VLKATAAAQRLTHKPVKFGTVTAELVAVALQDDHYPDVQSRIMALSAALNQELHRVADAGCPAIQME
jgi:5-methyltetrahydropteroyltriglutamate--homocysteine methyltransferase